MWRRDRGDRDLCTAGEGGRGREDRDRLHADLQRKPRKERLPGEREKEERREKERQSNTLERNRQ